MKSAIVFYSLYYLQCNKFYDGENASDLVSLLFKDCGDSIDAGKVIESLFESGQIVTSSEDEDSKRFKFGSFHLKSESSQEVAVSGESIITNDTNPLIDAALKTDYHPLVKDFLVEHLKKHRFDAQMIQGDALKACFDGCLLNPDDENAKKALNETLRWSFDSEKKAWQFLTLYYFCLVSPVFMTRPGDIVDTLFLQGNHSNSFISNVKDVVFKKYSEGKIVITGFKGASMRYELSN